MGSKKKNKAENKKWAALFRILEILHAYNNLNAGRIFEILSNEGYLPSNGASPSARRSLNNYLKELEEFGFIEKRGRGRNVRWHIKRSFIRDGCFLLPQQKAVLILLLLTAEEVLLRNLEEDLKLILSRFWGNGEVFSHLSRDINSKYLYAVNFKNLLPVLGKIIEAIEGRRYVSILFKEEKVYRKLLPTGLGIRNGKIYFIALLENGEERTFALENIASLSVRGETYGGDHYPRPNNYLLYGEKPFVFGIYVGKDLRISKGVINFHPFVFHRTFSPSGETVEKIYLVGFDSQYFAKNFLPYLYDPIPPNEEMLLIARRKGIDKAYPGLKLDDINHHQKTFRNFLKKARNELASRLKRVKGILKDN